jgi:hypothetical protein
MPGAGHHLVSARATAAGLLIDYVMTVAVSIAYGVAPSLRRTRRCSQRPYGSALA